MKLKCPTNKERKERVSQFNSWEEFFKKGVEEGCDIEHLRHVAALYQERLCADILNTPYKHYGETSSEYFKRVARSDQEKEI